MKGATDAMRARDQLYTNNRILTSRHTSYRDLRPCSFYGITLELLVDQYCIEAACSDFGIDKKQNT